MAGALPIPTTETDYQVKMGLSNIEHRTAEELWRRLFEHIRQKGWMIKGDRKMSLSNLAVEWQPN